MARVDCFEELVAWQKGRALVREAYRVAGFAEARRDFGFASQLRRAAVSVISNIAEGFERGGRREFHQFLSIAKGSCAEVRSLLYVANDVGYLNPERGASTIALAVEVGRLLGGLRAAVARQRPER